MPPHQIDLETLKLLVQVAWADHEVVPEEAELVLSLARQMEASEDEVEFLRRALCDEKLLLAPNLEMLRGHYEHVMQSVDQIIHIDKRIVDDERGVRSAIAHLLTEY